jgi:hypothetical protein
VHTSFINIIFFLVPFYLSSSLPHWTLHRIVGTITTTSLTIAMLVYRTVATSAALNEKTYELYTSMKRREDGKLVVSEQGGETFVYEQDEPSAEFIALNREYIMNMVRVGCYCYCSKWLLIIVDGYYSDGSTRVEAGSA